MSNLEDFLRQAAERRKQRERSGQQPGQAQPPQQNRPSNVYQPQILQAELVIEPEIIEPEIIEPEIISSVSERHLKPLAPTLSKTDRLAKDIDQADEKMAGRMNQVFDHQVGKLGKPKKAKPQSKAKTPRLSDNQPPPEIAVDRPADEVLEMLRQPQSLRVAFIASQIFNRKNF
jgi:hypothetical protein